MYTDIKGANSSKPKLMGVREPTFWFQITCIPVLGPHSMSTAFPVWLWAHESSLEGAQRGAMGFHHTSPILPVDPRQGYSPLEPRRQGLLAGTSLVSSGGTLLPRQGQRVHPGQGTKTFMLPCSPPENKHKFFNEKDQITDCGRAGLQSLSCLIQSLFFPLTHCANLHFHPRPRPSHS